MDIRFPNESSEYRAARDRLLEQEIALRRQTEAVAVARRALPPGGAVPEDYLFEGVDGPVRLSALFRPGTDTLILYQMMFPRESTDNRPNAESGEIAKLPVKDSPCPSCTALIDQLNGAADHVEAAGINFAVVAKTAIDNLSALGRDRGWTKVRLLSAADTGFKRAYLSEDDQGEQVPLVSVFQKCADGAVRHFWSSELIFVEPDPGQDQRAAGTLEPLWNLLDLTPHGRPDFMEQLQYDCCAGAKPALVEDA